MLQGIYTSLSALNTNQKALDVTSHNLANQNTEGYTKQRVNFSTNPIKDTANTSADIKMGTGTHVQSVERVEDPNLFNELLKANKNNQSNREMTSTINSLDNTLQNESFSNMYDIMFKNLHRYAEMPHNIKLQHLVEESAKNLKKRSQQIMEVFNNEKNKNTFYEVYLKQLFFKAFNNRGGFKDISPELKDILSNAPYLNGGLYKENKFDKLDVKLNDSIFEEIFKFFNHYNFTIKEDVLVREVAVDPEMIGYVYESLANVAEEIYTNHDLGIFYTPREEVDFMCRNALVEYLNNKIKVDKDILYDLIFAEDKSRAENELTRRGLWEDIQDTLDDISVVDPACGSGAFLVGMLMVLSEITSIVNRHLGGKKKDYEIKERIIQRNLYGVDVMPWAVQCAELRLWLQLVVESDLNKNDLKLGPILPNLDLNIMTGDSVVQQSGGIGIEFNLREMKTSQSIKKRINKLAEERKKYSNNDRTALFKDKRGFIQEEINIFSDFIDTQIKSLKDKIPLLYEKINDNFLPGGFLDENISKEEHKTAEREVGEIKEKIEKLRTIRSIIQDPKKKPFIWEMDFAEVFSNKNGFDIVIGNPPYLRQEDIIPPNKLKGEITKEDRIKYKAMLNKSVISKYPPKFIKHLSGRSDLYVYFYFIGLSLLNPDGVFSFITSNSWLDVDYGKTLQEFLLKYVPIIGIYDNEKKRSFEHADINTAIVLFKAPQITKNNPTEYTAENNTAKFVMFKKPFEEVITAENLKEIDKVKLPEGEDLKKYPDKGSLFKEDKGFRVVAVRQSYLYEEGLDRENGKEVYVGNKWGGKYLRAPDIFYTILEKGKGKLIELGRIAKIRRGFTTGANDFFYVEDIGRQKIKFADIKDKIANNRGFKSFEEIKRAGLNIVKPSKYKKGDKDYKLFLIEEEYLKPVIKSPKELKNIVVREEDLNYKVFMCNESKKDLKNKFALDYIEWGERNKEWFDSKSTRYNPPYKRPTCRSRKYWWGLKRENTTSLICMMSYNDRFGFWINENLFIDARLYEIKNSAYNAYNLSISLNNTFTYLQQELIGRANLGEGALDFKVYETEILFILIPEFPYKNEEIIKLNHREIKSIFEELGFDPNKPIRNQEPNPLPDRAELDKVVFDELGLTEEERKEVYWSVAELVKNRLDKAKSLKKKR